MRKEFKVGFTVKNYNGETLVIEYSYSTKYYLSELYDNEFIVKIDGGNDCNFSSSDIENFLNN